MIVEVTKEEVGTLSRYAIDRWLMKWGSQDRPNYSVGKKDGVLEHEVLASIRTIIAEWVVAKQYNLTMNVPWYPNDLHAKRGGLADVGQAIEVRTTRTQDWISVWEKDENKYIFGVRCLDPEHFTQFEILGYIHFDEVISHPEWWIPRHTAWGVPLHALKPYQSE